MVGAVLIISLVEAVYFFRLLGLTQQKSHKENIEIPILKKLILGLIATMIIYLGVFPDDLLAVCESVASTLIGAENV